MAKWIVTYHQADAIEAAIEAVDNSVTIHVIPISNGREFMLIKAT